MQTLVQIGIVAELWLREGVAVEGVGETADWTHKRFGAGWLRSSASSLALEGQRDAQPDIPAFRKQDKNLQAFFAHVERCSLLLHRDSKNFVSSRLRGQSAQRPHQASPS